MRKNFTRNKLAERINMKLGYSKEEAKEFIETFLNYNLALDLYSDLTHYFLAILKPHHHNLQIHQDVLIDHD